MTHEPAVSSVFAVTTCILAMPDESYLVTLSIDLIRSDTIRIARNYAPCDIVAADIETGMPDEKVKALYRIVNGLNSRNNYFQ